MEGLRGALEWASIMPRGVRNDNKILSLTNARKGAALQAAAKGATVFENKRKNWSGKSGGKTGARQLSRRAATEVRRAVFSQFRSEIVS